MRFRQLAFALLASAAAARAGFDVVREGRPAAVIIVADRPTEVSRYAARELAWHVGRATGARLAIAGESEAAPMPGARIFLGDTRAARKAGIDVARLAPEVFVLRAAGECLFIAGNDDPGDPLDTATYAGTLLGVYAWLEEQLGVRWLWPGELGTHVPSASTVRVQDADRTVAPRFFQRQVRGGLTFRSDHPSLGFSPDAAAEYAREQAVYLRRHRMGKGVRLSYGHAFTDWWSRYGAEHPEWFQLVNGRRGPTKPGASYSMCVSNPEFRRRIVELWREKRAAAAPGAGPRFVNAIENGIMGLCECDSCRAWDGPKPEDYLRHYSPKSKVIGSRFVTDRYVRYWLDVQHQAAETDPDATVVVYNYFNYFHPPTPGTRLNRNILVGSYPSAGWFPRSEEEHAWFKGQWVRWQETGARLFSRGNYCLDGYNMPLAFARQFADEFRHQAAHGMEATDYDALTGQWATQGTNIYVLMRLHARPDAPTDELLAEYCAAFGAAAPRVREYFDFWEGYALEHRARINRAFEDMDASRWRTWAIAAHVVFPQECFDRASGILGRAAADAAGDAEAAARVGFLRTGLEHARLCARISAALTVADPASTPERGAALLAELMAFRRAHEREWIGNFNHSAWVEDRSWRLAPTPQPAAQAAPASSAAKDSPPPAASR